MIREKLALIHFQFETLLAKLAYGFSNIRGEYRRGHCALYASRHQLIEG
jgi:hypothetical protein